MTRLSKCPRVRHIGSGTAGMAVKDPDAAVSAQSDTSFKTSENAGPVGGRMIVGTSMTTGIL